jgi:hypothetical protein
MQTHAPLPPQAGGDRFYDLSLHILMIFVSVALVGSVAFLTYKWLAEPRDTRAYVPVVPIAAKPAPPAANTTPSAAPPREVLMNPGQIFKCNTNGRITFSEQPCPAAAAAEAAAANNKAPPSASKDKAPVR